MQEGEQFFEKKGVPTEHYFRQIRSVRRIFTHFWSKKLRHFESIIFT